jgi:hypothetical protein
MIVKTFHRNVSTDVSDVPPERLYRCIRRSIGTSLPMYQTFHRNVSTDVSDVPSERLYRCIRRSIGTSLPMYQTFHRNVSTDVSDVPAERLYRCISLYVQTQNKLCFSTRSDRLSTNSISALVLTVFDKADVFWVLAAVELPFLK